jgi:nicotinamide-nucleotide amidase
MRADDLVRAMRNKGWKLATAESCTGGMVAAAMTDIAGSSDVFDRGFVRNSIADVAVSITGVAGPGGGSDEKPVGLVHFACATKEKTEHLEMRFGDLTRAAIRKAAVRQALQLVFLAL